MQCPHRPLVRMEPRLTGLQDGLVLNPQIVRDLALRCLSAAAVLPVLRWPLSSANLALKDGDVVFRAYPEIQNYDC